MLESQYQAQLKKTLENMFPGCFIIKNDEQQLQGIPDLLILYRSKWAMLEVKAWKGALRQPNQDYYVRMFDDMSFAAFIYPENEEDVLRDLQRTFQPRRAARVPQR